MWIARIEIFHKNCFVLGKTIETKIIDGVYPLSCWKENDNYFLTHIHFLQGEIKNKKAFISKLKNDKRIKRVEEHGDVLFTLTLCRENDKHLAPLFLNKKLFLLEPMIHSNKELWTIGAWEKKELLELFKEIKKVGEIKVISVQNKKMMDVYVPKIMAGLTEKQKEALSLAYSEGYYSYPRKIKLEQLAKIFRISLNSVRERLRRAEAKIVPFFTKNNQEKK